MEEGQNLLCCDLFPLIELSTLVLILFVFVGPLLSALGAFDGHWPPYASHVVLELLEDTQGSCFYFLCCKEFLFRCQ